MKGQSVILSEQERKNQKKAIFEKKAAKMNLKDRRLLQLVKWLETPDIYREWCEIGHEITMLCQMLDLAMQDFERLGGDMFADLQLHKNAVKAMDRMVDHEFAEWTKQGDEEGKQWVSMIGAAQALRERFSIIMNYSFGEKAEWRLNEFNKFLDRSYPDSLREAETAKKRHELVEILSQGGISENEALKTIDFMKENGIIS